MEADGAAFERDVVYELAFMRPDTLDDAGVGQYVEFTGILIDITGGTGTPVITADPGRSSTSGPGRPTVRMQTRSRPIPATSFDRKLRMP